MEERRDAFFEDKIKQLEEFQKRGKPFSKRKTRHWVFGGNSKSKQRTTSGMAIEFAVSLGSLCTDSPLIRFEKFE